MSQVDEVMIEIYRAIYAALEQKFYLIGSVIDAEARREILDKKIYDKGDFYGNTGFMVENDNEGLILRVGSNVKHEPFVLGGKVPSWTPIAPLKAWVQRKNLNWLDKDGHKLKVDQIAYMIRAKIRREGIEARNVFEAVIDRKEQWIINQFNSIEVNL